MAVMLVRFRFFMPGFYRIEFDAKRPEPRPGRLIKRKDYPLQGRHMTIAPIVIALLCLLIAIPAQAARVARATQIPGTFDQPLYVTGAPGSNTLLFVVEQTGRVQVLENEIKQARPFLNVSSRLACCGERGLLSIAFAPDYATSRLFYIAFTNRNGDVEIDEYKRSLTSPKLADPTSARRLLVVPHQEAGNHNGGQLQFGPDGYLYISIGDGGEVFPRGKYARNLNILLGKILRIDPTPQGGQPYTIPADNPFVGIAQRRSEIYAYGLRNPWRFAFDGNRIAIADVGQTQQEEINFLTAAGAKGVNFGWPQFEGKVIFDNSQPKPPGPAKMPMTVYTHVNGRCAIIGGYVSHDVRIAALSNRYLFGDLCTGEIFSLLPNAATQQATEVRPVGITAPNLTSFGVGPNNRIYITQQTGQLSRIDPF
jgi:glucose/arabinose dehydrogenase